MSEQESVFLWECGGGELAREVPRQTESGGFATGDVIAQEIREASATTAGGIVRVSEVDGRWVLDPDGIEAYIS